MRNPETGTVKLVVNSGIGTPDARKKLASALERLGFFRGLKLLV
jgi:hypothetical protein